MSQAVEQALQLIRENRPESTDRALALLQNTVYSFSMKVCGHPQDAEDTMQDVLLKSLPASGQVRQSAGALGLAVQGRAQPVREQPPGQPVLSRQEPVAGRVDAPQPRAAGIDEQRRAQSRGRPAEQRKRRATEAGDPGRASAVPDGAGPARHGGAEHGEVAKIMDLREGTVRVRLHRARLFVRQHLAQLAKARRDTGLTIHAAAEEPRPPRCRRLFAALSDYMDGVIDDAMCDEMDRHLHDCEPCQAFLASLKNAVAQCRSYPPQCDSARAEELRRETAAQVRAGGRGAGEEARTGRQITYVRSAVGQHLLSNLPRE